jgi:hypothetical protein
MNDLRLMRLHHLPSSIWHLCQRSCWSGRCCALLLVLAIALASFTTGCTHNRRVRVKRFDTQAIAGAKTPVNLALVLDSAFTNFTFVYSLTADTYRLPMGPALTQYATDAAQAACQTVTVYPSAEAAAGKAPAILIPRVAKVNMTTVAGFAKRQFLICVEWSLMDRDNQKLLWLDTVPGQGEYMSAMEKGRERKLIQFGYDDLSRKTVQCLRQSPAVARLGTTL